MWRQYERDIKALPAVEKFNTDKQVPQSLPAIANVAYHGATRVHDLESRIKVSEQSNRLLLEELMKLQQDLKLALRQNEEMVMKERQERIAVREKVEAAENMYNRVSMQLMRTEEKVNMEHNTLQTLLNQSKEVERTLAGGQQRSILKGEQTDRYINRFRDELSELKQMNEQIQSSLRLVGEDVKNLQHRFEMQNSEFESISQDMKQKVKRIETESIAAMENIQRNKSSRESFEGTSQLKQNIESRLSEIRDAVNEVKRKAELEASERRAADQQADLNVEKVQVAVRELETKYQEVSHTASLSMREKDNVHEVEKSKLAYKMAELSEETNKKALQREMQLREEAQMKFTILEKRYHEEQTSKLAFEKSIRHEMEKILDSVKMHLAEELQSMRQNAKLTKVHEDQSLVKMNQCITLLESEIEAGKKAFEEVLHAEIVARQTQNEETLDRCNELQEKLSVAVATLQQAISGVTSHTQEAVEQAKNEIFAVLDNSTNSGVKGLADIDNRLTNLNKHVADLEEAIESRPRPPSSPNMEEIPPNEDYERLSRKVERAHKWQEEAEKRLKDLNTKLHPIHSEISKLKGAIEDLENEMEARRLARLASLADNNTPVAPAKPETPAQRETPTHDPDLEKKVQKAEGDIVQISTQMEKLENTVNTLRTVLSQKISSEAKTVDQMRQIFTGDIEKIVNYFIREQRHVFVKHRPHDAKVYRPDVTKDGENQAHSIHLALLGINRWGIYEAYRMLKVKQAWFNVVENKKNTPTPDENYMNYNKNEKESDSEDEEKGDKKVEDDESENEESGKDDDDENSEENEDSEEEKESEEEEESEVEESEEEEEESEDESEDDNDDDNKEEDEKDSGSEEETTGENKKDQKSDSKPQAKTAAKSQAKPSGST